MGADRATVAIIGTPAEAARALANIVLPVPGGPTRSAPASTSACRWIDVENGIFHRAAQGEAVSLTKQAGSVRIPDRLLVHMRRWARTRRYLCEWNGRPADPRKGLSLAMDAVFGEDHPYVRHTLRHTCAMWLLWSGTDIGDIAAYLSMTRDVLLRVYGHEHPDADRAVGEAFSKGTAGRRGRR